MKIIDLADEHLSTYFHCLEDWSDDMKESGTHKETWYKSMKTKGLGVKLALDDGTVGGMIQYVPSEFSFIEGDSTYLIKCIWVHGYKEGIGNFQRKGMGKALLKAAEEDVQKRGAIGIAAWGLSLPFWMKASWFKKQGYKKVDKVSIQVLLWKSFDEKAKPPRLIRQKKKPQKTPEKVQVTSFINGWCPVQNLAHERAKRASNELGDEVEFIEINTFNKENFQEWGIYDGLFIDDKEIRTGPPPSYEKIKKKIEKQVKKL